MIQVVLIFCNLSEIPDTLEPFIRRKVKNIINYEKQHGNTAFDVKSISEGDTSISYHIDASTSKETIYGLSDQDKALLKCYRKVRK